MKPSKNYYFRDIDFLLFYIAFHILQQNQIPGGYNNGMTKKIRLFLAILVLTISLALLVWGLWPNLMETRIVPVDPSQMQLPTPASYYIGGLG
jgi:hypothetical protein